MARPWLGCSHCDDNQVANDSTPNQSHSVTITYSDPLCPVCGGIKPGHTLVWCGYPHTRACTCSQVKLQDNLVIDAQKTISDIDAINKMNERMGWVCPICGRGVSPYRDTCICKPTLEEMADEALEEHRAGRTKPIDCDKKR